MSICIIDSQPTGKTYAIRALNQLMVYSCNIPWYGRWTLQVHFIGTAHLRRTKSSREKIVSLIIIIRKNKLGSTARHNSLYMMCS